MVTTAYPYLHSRLQAWVQGTRMHVHAIANPVLNVRGLDKADDPIRETRPVLLEPPAMAIGSWLYLRVRV
jgi:hypothetical protein